MKKLFLILIVVSLSAVSLGSQKIKTKSHFDNELMTKEQCSKLGEDLQVKLEGLATSEGLPKDTFSVSTKMDFKRTGRSRITVICLSKFTSQNPNYGFLTDSGVRRHGSDRKAQCDLDYQNLVSQSNNLGVESTDLVGFDFRSACVISSISLQKIL